MGKRGTTADVRAGTGKFCTTGSSRGMVSLGWRMAGEAKRLVQLNKCPLCPRDRLSPVGAATGQVALRMYPSSPPARPRPPAEPPRGRLGRYSTCSIRVPFAPAPVLVPGRPLAPLRHSLPDADDRRLGLTGRLAAQLKAGRTGSFEYLAEYPYLRYLTRYSIAHHLAWRTDIVLPNLRLNMADMVPSGACHGGQAGPSGFDLRLPPRAAGSTSPKYDWVCASPVWCHRAQPRSARSHRPCLLTNRLP